MLPIISQLGFLLLVSLNLPNSVSQANENKSTDLLYYVTIGTDADDFDSEAPARKSIRATSSDSNGDILISINNNPVKFRYNEGFLFPVNQFLKSGKNTISLTGECEDTLFLRVFKCAHLSDSKSKVLLEAELVSDSNLEISYTGWFISNTKYAWPFFKTTNSNKNRNKSKQEIYSLIKSIEKSINKKQSKTAAALLTSGFKIYQKRAYKHSDKGIDAMIEARAAYFSKSTTSVSEINNIDELEFTFGKNLVIVSKKSKNKKHLFEMNVSTGKSYKNPPIIFAKINDNWIVW